MTCESKILEIQQRTHTASKAGDKTAVSFSQDVIINSLDAKSLSIENTTIEHSGKNASRVDVKHICCPKTHVNCLKKSKLMKNLFKCEVQ